MMDLQETLVGFIDPYIGFPDLRRKINLWMFPAIFSTSLI